MQRRYAAVDVALATADTPKAEARRGPCCLARFEKSLLPSVERIGPQQTAGSANVLRLGEVA
jgi:hypothetical protein